MAAIRQQALLRSMIFEEKYRTHPSAEWTLNTGSSINDALEIANFRTRTKNRTTDGVAENFSFLPPIAPKPAMQNKLETAPAKYILAQHLFDRFSPVSEQTVMSMRDENIGRLPASLAMISHLQIVDVSHNQLKQMSEGIGDLVELRELNLSSNLLQSLPESIGNCRKLEAVRLRQNEFRRMPILHELTRLTLLDLSDNPRLEELDPSLATLRGLSDLDVRHAALRLLPDELCELRSSLTALRAGYNYLVELPPRVGRLAALRTLDLRCNQLTSLPYGGVERLAALRELDLSGNHLTALPRALGLCGALETLCVAANRLRALPASAAHLAALTSLDAARNRLRRLPDPARLTRLRALRVGGNRLRALPPGLHRLPDLAEVDALYNPRLVAPPPAVVLQGTRPILDFLRQHDPTPLPAAATTNRFGRAGGPLGAGKFVAAGGGGADGDWDSSGSDGDSDDGGGRAEDALPGFLEAARLELSEFELRAAAREAEEARALALARREARAAARAAANGGGGLPALTATVPRRGG